MLLRENMEYPICRNHLEKFVFLAAPTARSQAYIQSMAVNGFFPKHVVIMGREECKSNNDSTPPNFWNEIQLPNLNESISFTCEKFNIPYITCQSKSTNSEEVNSCLRKLNPDFVIYSGAGGEIVSKQTLAIASFLHMHSGWLPDYRGSTTVYYSLLNHENPGVTALFLDANIDTGPIIAQKKYPLPPHSMDIDYIYDPAIRADLLIKVLSYYVQNEKFEHQKKQSNQTANNFYVIHPVLKHLAILSLTPRKAPQNEHTQ